MKYANIIAAGHQNNSQFAVIDSAHKYGSTYLMRLLRDAFLNKGIEINTPDINFGREISFEIYVEAQPLQKNTLPKYLLAFENPLINPLNADLMYCKQFNHVFSWNPRLADVGNFTLLMVPNELLALPFRRFDSRTIFSTLINANKRFPKQVPDDLYEERLTTIKWYESNFPKSFHLYGLGWDKPRPAQTNVEKLIRRIYRLRTQIYGYKPFSSYRGPVENKASVYSLSKFAFCYENTKNIENYITEKIFDAMMSGCVPIYWGANNVEKYIPKECFIDRRLFRDNAELHDFLESIDDKKYLAYQEAINRFLQSSEMHIFKAEYWVSRLINIIV